MDNHRVPTNNQWISSWGKLTWKPCFWPSKFFGVFLQRHQFWDWSWQEDPQQKKVISMMYQQNHSAKGWTESTHFSSSLSPINENIHWRLNNPLKHLRKSTGPIHASSSFWPMKNRCLFCQFRSWLVLYPVKMAISCNFYPHWKHGKKSLCSAIEPGAAKQYLPRPSGGKLRTKKIEETTWYSEYRKYSILKSIVHMYEYIYILIPIL